MSETHPIPVGAIGCYHAHVYFDAATRAAAERVRAGVSARFAVQLGRWREEPVGPHPRPMFQIAFDVGLFATLVPWLMLNREGLTVLIHPETDRPRDNHLVHAAWLGEVLPLNGAVLPETSGPPDAVVPNTTPTEAP
jgi:DOPA 4,5-dioxygenase